MILSKNKWKIQYGESYADNEIIDILHKIKGIDDYVRYYNLGFKDFNDPFKFKNMDIVIKKIKMSIKNNDKILIYGDYDVDGITATAILYRILKEKGADVHFMVPNRFQDGYGLSPDAVESIISSGYNLVITVDNGITNIDEIDLLLKANVSVILTDHHEPKDTIPKTDYIVHSYIFHDYPFEYLCGAGVAYKIAEAIDKDYARKYIDLAMMGTIADMMPLIGENKAIVNEGLKIINNTSVTGLKALLKSMDIEVRGTKDISYSIAPKLNSLGRIGDASVAISLLIEENPSDIEKDIKRLYEADNLRKELTIQNTELAYKLINPTDSVNVIYSSSFYEGVLGIIAQKVMKRTNKITGVFNIDDQNNARGSFRTIGEYNILEMLEENKDLLQKFGGHEKACGVTMEASNLKELKDRLQSMVGTFKEETYETVALALNHSLISADFYADLQMYDLQDNMFLFKDLYVVQSSLLVEKHTKLKAKLENGKYINVIIFNDPGLSYNISPGDKIDLIGELNINKYNGQENLQIIASDYEVMGLQVVDYRKSREYEQASKYFDTDNGLVINQDFESLSELSLLIKEQSPNIVYLAPVEYDITADQVTNKNLLKQAIYIISSNIAIKEIMLAKELKVSRQTLDVIIEIFEELNLIIVDGDKISSNPREKGLKVELESSETFLYYKEVKLVQDLLYGDIDMIKKYVLEALE